MKKYSAIIVAIIAVIMFSSFAITASCEAETENVEFVVASEQIETVEPTVPPMPEIISIDELPELAYTSDKNSQDKNIDVIEQIDFIDTAIEQCYKRIEWIENYTEDNIAIHYIMNYIENLTNIRNEYMTLGEYTYKEWRELATCAWYEGNSCPTFFKEWVCQVVLNRCSSSYFPDNIHDNLIRKGQYNPSYVKESWANDAKKTSDSWYERGITDTNMWDDSLFAAQNAMMGKVDMPENVIFQSNYSSLGDGYWQVYVSPFGSYSYFSYKN